MQSQRNFFSTNYSLIHLRIISHIFTPILVEFETHRKILANLLFGSTNFEASTSISALSDQFWPNFDQIPTISAPFLFISINFSVNFPVDLSTNGRKPTEMNNIWTTAVDGHQISAATGHQSTKMDIRGQANANPTSIRWLPAANFT